MTETITLELDEAVAAQLRRGAAELGESFEGFVSQVLTEAASDITGAMGDDEELQRRIDEYDRTGESVPSAEVHAWLRSLLTASPLERPKPRRFE